MPAAATAVRCVCFRDGIAPPNWHAEFPEGQVSNFFGIPALLSQLCFGSLGSAQSLSYTGATGVARTPLRHVRCLLGLFAR